MEPSDTSSITAIRQITNRLDEIENRYKSDTEFMFNEVEGLTRKIKSWADTSRDSNNTITELKEIVSKKLPNIDTMRKEIENLSKGAKGLESRLDKRQIKIEKDFLNLTKEIEELKEKNRNELKKIDYKLEKHDLEWQSFKEEIKMNFERLNAAVGTEKQEDFERETLKGEVKSLGEQVKKIEKVQEKFDADIETLKIIQNQIKTQIERIEDFNIEMKDDQDQLRDNQDQLKVQQIKVVDILNEQRRNQDQLKEQQDKIIEILNEQGDKQEKQSENISTFLDHYRKTEAEEAPLKRGLKILLSRFDIEV